MSELPTIPNIYLEASANAAADLVSDEAAFAAAKENLENSRREAEDLERKKNHFPDLLKSIEECVIDFPITRLDWEVAKLEATYRADEQIQKPRSVGIDQISIHIDLSNDQGYRKSHEEIMQREMKNIADTVFVPRGNVLDIYKSVIEKTIEKINAAKPRGFISPIGGQRDVEAAQKRIKDKLPDVLRHAPDVFRQGVSIETIVAPLREGSAREELAQLNKEQNSEGSSTAFGRYVVDRKMIEALRPLYDLRRAHLDTFLNSIAPRQAA